MRTLTAIKLKKLNYLRHPLEVKVLVLGARFSQEYDGFYQFAKMLENLAQGIADGVITVPEPW
ncbi:hypothetical protein [Merismopedia glauca]|uniref:hypothetical protein n=1 Tax=Merismopedia glauca TaxID=292586 RepID=UPI0011B21299|nr:hypothetical protein [Merismopedia glauca]